MGWFSKKKKEPASAEDILKKLNVSKTIIPTLINSKTKKLDRNEVEGLLPKKQKEKIFKEFNKYKIDPDKPAEDKSKPLSDPARFKNLKFGKVYNGKTRKAKYTV
jgi:hypothetical protein